MTKPFIQPTCRYGHGAMSPAVADDRKVESAKTFKIFAKLPGAGSIAATLWSPEQSIPVRIWQCAACTYLEVHSIAEGQN